MLTLPWTALNPSSYRRPIFYPYSLYELGKFLSRVKLNSIPKGRPSEYFRTQLGNWSNRGWPIYTTKTMVAMIVHDLFLVSMLVFVVKCAPPVKHNVDAQGTGDRSVPL